MTDAPAIDDPLSSLPIPPLSPYILSNDDLTFDDDFFSFDDDQFFINQSHPFDLPSPDPEEFIDFVPVCETAGTVSGNCSGNPNFTSIDGSGNVIVDGNVNLISELRNDSLLGNYGSDGCGIVDVSLPDGFGRVFGEENVNLERILNDSPSNELPVSSQGSGSCGSGGLEPAINYPSPDSGNSVNRNLKSNFVSDRNTPDDSGRVFVDEDVNLETILNNFSSELRNENPVSSGSEHGVNCSSPDSGNSVVNRKMKREMASNIVLKRKNESFDHVNLEARTIKNRRSNEGSIITESLNQVNETDDKKKARLIRNRESAQLSRQRKKQYVEELEDKVKTMHATIMDLNARVSYFAAENATLKQQMVAGASGGGMCSPPVMYPPHPGMAPVGYPWMQYPPYVVKSHGSQVPLLPIPKLKTQQPASSQKSKKDVKKIDGTSKTKTRKVASISFIGLLLFIVLFGGLVPIMNVKFGGVTDGSHLVKPNHYKFDNQQHQGRVLMSDELVNGTNLTNRNASEPLVASLYVPRNNKLVKIDGSLIISSVLASEKAMAFREEQELVKKEEQETAKNDDTGLAVALDLVPAIPIPTVNRVGGRQPHMYRTSSDHQRALPSNENLQSKHVDGNMQQWFREGLSGLMLSSGMCTEVFQFDASVAGASGAIVPATPAVNITATENLHNSTHITTVKNRRILHSLPIPLSDSTTNITKEQVSGHDSKHEDHLKNKSVSSMVVSVLVDPREAGDGGDVDGVMGGIGGGGKGKSFSRIFVVVLLDSVKYVTYSCMLPLKGGSHVVTA